MTIAIRYQSKGGNTKVVAEAIGTEVGVTAESIETPISEPVDLLIIGGGVYAWGLDQSLKTYLENLDPNTVKKVAAFTTAGGMDKTKDILEIVKSKGISAIKETLAVKFLWKYHATFGGAGKAVLNDKQIAAIQAFVKNLTGREQE